MKKLMEDIIPFNSPFHFTQEMAWDLHFKIADDVHETIPFSTEIHPEMFVYLHFNRITEDRLIYLQNFFSTRLLNDIQWITTWCSSNEVIVSLQINF